MLLQFPSCEINISSLFNENKVLSIYFWFLLYSKSRSNTLVSNNSMLSRAALEPVHHRAVATEQRVVPFHYISRCLWFESRLQRASGFQIILRVKLCNWASYVWMHGPTDPAHCSLYDRPSCLLWIRPHSNCDQHGFTKKMQRLLRVRPAADVVNWCCMMFPTTHSSHRVFSFSNPHDDLLGFVQSFAQPCVVKV